LPGRTHIGAAIGIFVPGRLLVARILDRDGDGVLKVLHGQHRRAVSVVKDVFDEDLDYPHQG
jgi:hypothetical protein